ncbi:MAG: DUF433 domain-containing protein [Bacillota bacterium]
MCALYPGFADPVATIVDLFAGGLTREEILRYYPDLDTQTLTKHCNLLRKRFANVSCRWPENIEVLG